MGWVKQVFTDFVTVIGASFLNGLQDQIIDDETTLANKVDKITGKGLSTNDYTDAEKTKLGGIAAGAQVNVKSDWNAQSGDAQILNKPGNATNATPGFMSATDKAKLDALPENSDLEASLGAKLDKRTASGEEVYTHAGTTQGGRSVSSAPAAGAVPVYDANGRLKANAPSASNDVIRKYEHDGLVSDLEAGTEATANLHLGFYLDANGDLCQVETDE